MGTHIRIIQGPSSPSCLTTLAIEEKVEMLYMSRGLQTVKLCKNVILCKVGRLSQILSFNTYDSLKYTGASLNLKGK